MTHSSSRVLTTVGTAAVLGVLLLATAVVPVRAQSAIYGAGLQAWLGCWSADLATARGIEPPSIVCITPTANVNVADVVTIQDARVVSREPLDASGRPRPIDAARCTGTRSASWSRDGRRLFVRSVGSCAGVPSSTSGLLAMTADGDWLDVEGISAGGATSVRVARYRDVAPPPVLPLGARTALRDQSLATRSVRVAAGAPVRGEDLLEAARAVDSAVLEAWILEGAQRFAVSDAEVTSLMALGVSARVADALGALADPQAYTLARGDDERIVDLRSTSYDDAWGSYGLPLGWGWGYWVPAGSRYGPGYGGRRRPGHYRPPIVIVRGHDGRPRGPGTRGRDHPPPGDGRRTAPSDGVQRPSAEQPPPGDPRRAPASQGSGGGTVRLGRPRG